MRERFDVVIAARAPPARPAAPWQASPVRTRPSRAPDLFEFCNANMAYFMVPRYLVVRKTLPKTGTMRVEKYKLRQEGISAGAADRAELGITLNR
jgi:acyl-CoA synthetase (AMP-forming)/AMP-acid ligase II